MSSPQWNPGRSNGRGVGAWRVRTVVSGRLRARPKVLNVALVSPMPCRRRRMLGGGRVLVVVVFGAVIEMFRCGGKSAWVGVFVGIFLFFSFVY